MPELLELAKRIKKLGNDSLFSSATARHFYVTYALPLAEYVIRREEGVEPVWCSRNGFHRCGKCETAFERMPNYCPHCGAKIRRPEC